MFKAESDDNLRDMKIFSIDLLAQLVIKSLDTPIERLKVRLLRVFEPGFFETNYIQRVKPRQSKRKSVIKMSQFSI